MDLKSTIKSYRYKKEKIGALFLQGDIDLVTIPTLEKKFHYFKKKKIYNLVIELSQVEMITSSGWGIFIGELQEFQNNKGDIRFAAMKSNILDIFHLLELDTFFYHFNELNETIKSFVNLPQPKTSYETISKKSHEKEFGTFRKEQHGRTSLTEKTIRKLKIREEKLIEQLETLKETIVELKAQNKKLENTINYLIAEHTNHDHSNEEMDADNLTTMIKEVVQEFPNFGPQKIMQTIEDHNHDLPIVSRSTIYRRLCLLGLNTREKRKIFAKKSVPNEF